MDESDETLFLHGSAEAMARLVARYERPLYAFLYRFCGDRQLAEDLFQEKVRSALATRKYGDTPRAGRIRAARAGR